MVKVEGLAKHYGALAAVDRVSFEIRAREAIGLLGVNGAGKTTLLRMISGFLIPSAGRVSVAGYDILENPVAAKRHIGYLPETPPLYADLTVREYLEYIARLKEMRQLDIRPRIRQVLGILQLEDVATRFIRELSLGYRKRVGIAQAILNQPEVVIMDEPISGLDPKQIIEMRNLINDLKKEHAIVISSHILSEVARTCDRLLFIHKGRIVAEQSNSALLDRINKMSHYDLQIAGVGARQAEDLQRAVGAIRGIISVARRASEENAVSLQLGVDSAWDWKKSLWEEAVRRNWNILSFQGQSVDLETIFMELTQ